MVIGGGGEIPVSSVFFPGLFTDLNVLGMLLVEIHA